MVGFLYAIEVKDVKINKTALYGYKCRLTYRFIRDVLDNSHGNSRPRPILDTHTYSHIGIKSYHPRKKSSIQK